ncbi:hypothetical protein [Alicyclobacillus acidoterrestris]|uniref:Uncharacterized protein n=1 Tax=Alicyclobacillus acidoterrestris (strain ATCC 49025 / DSM 3922 / CIP 106132 / NCIMB 13137 / GD3B) TaxID=1356854 RepID=T0DDF8_ALIAG|nr:hypothetical protein [Alicyclobacillus acidoterrestris]EPZ47696.1 hypothetical protein N007_05430 [Alicyclobacillus acidoterrestris ATCC 49025]UNO47989.1 hypothetical protein K1I37_15045 [Alicyclobacillus acidoterrestris]
MINPSECSKHIILLCKGHHKFEDNLTAVKHFIAEWCDLEVSQVCSSTVYELVLDAMCEIVDKQKIKHFIRDIFRFQESVHCEDVIRHMMAVIATTKVKDEQKILINLDVDDKIVQRMLERAMKSQQTLSLEPTEGQKQWMRLMSK